MAQVEELLVRVRGEIGPEVAAGLGKLNAELQQSVTSALASGASLDDLATAQRAVNAAIAGARTDQARQQYAALALQLDAAEGAMRRAAGGTAVFGSNLNTANRVGIEASRVINDLQAGAFGGLRGVVIAVSNNLDGFTSAMRQAKAEGVTLRQVLTGSGGVALGLGAVATAAVLLPPLIEGVSNFFRETGDAADDAAESYGEALNRLVRFEHESRRFAALTAAQAEAEYNRAKADQARLQGDIDRLRQERNALVTGGVQIPGREILAQPDLIADPERYAVLGDRIRTASDDLALAGQRADFFAGALREAAVQARVLGDIALTPEEPRRPRRRDPRDAGDVLADLRERLAGIDADLRQGLLNPLTAAQERAEALAQALNSIRTAGARQGSAAQIADLQGRLAEARDEAEGLAASLALGTEAVRRDSAALFAQLDLAAREATQAVVDLLDKQAKAVLALKAARESLGDAGGVKLGDVVDFGPDLPAFLEGLTDEAVLDGLRAVLGLTRDIGDAFGDLLTLQTGFEGFADAVGDALRRMVAEMVAAAARMAALRVAFAFLDVIAPGLGTLAAGGTFYSTGGNLTAPAVPMANLGAGGLTLTLAQAGESVAPNGDILLRLRGSTHLAATRSALQMEGGGGLSGKL